MNRIYTTLCLLLFFCTAWGQRGKDGAATITSSVKVNEYTFITADAAAGSTSIAVANSALNTNSRFANNLVPGDLIMIIQMQGANVLTGVYDSTWGSITSYNNCGLYELREVASVPNSTTIDLTCPLINSYTDTGNVQIVRVQRYSSLTINAGGNIGCDGWNGQDGGVIAIEVLGATIINGSVNADSLGFRGGQLGNVAFNSLELIETTFDTNITLGGQKGEGIAGYQASYNILGGMYCRGAAANAGGGGDGWNCAGGGGGNGGSLTAYNGDGNPDTSNPNWVTAWNLEYAGFALNVSSGGGRGGYAAANGTNNPLTVGPGNGLWGSTIRNNMGGKGGRPLDYSTGRLFLGGGGGAGHEDSHHGGAGANGGGLIYLTTYGNISGTGLVKSNGQHGFVAHGNAGDGAGGGGAGGTIVITSTGTISGITVSANGGDGGNQDINSATECEGPGGGGSGGYIGLSNTGVSQSILPGVNGTTNAGNMTAFPPNGGTKGGFGDTATVVPNFTIAANGDTICRNLSTTLTASLTGTVPPGTAIEWFDSAKGVTPVGTGTTYNTPVLNGTDTFYVGTCPGTYRLPVIVVCSNPRLVKQSDSVCIGDSITLNATGGSAYLWSTGATTSSIKVSPPSIHTYSVTITGYLSCGDSSMTATVAVVNYPHVLISGDTQVCNGLADTLNINGSTYTYLWSNGNTTTQYILHNITGDSTVSVKINNAMCALDTTIHVSAKPFPLVTVQPQSICTGTCTLLTANASGNGLTYHWSNGATTDTTTVCPSSNNTYTVNVSNGCNTESTAAVTVYTTSFYACCDTTIGKGDTANLFASGAIHYSWSPSAAIDCDTCHDVKVHPDETTTYTVIGIDAHGCEAERAFTVTVETPCADFTVPNIFTPNNDGINDDFVVHVLNVSSYNLTVFDRWGKQVFASSDPSVYWNGRINSTDNLAPDGTYYYVLTASCSSNKYTKKGFVIVAGEK